MGRPRAHEPDVLLDHARDLWAESGAEGLTIRALSARSSASNGAIYHAFGSRDSLLLQVWARTAESFLDHQEAAVAGALGEGSPQEAADAVVAAAVAPATYAELDPAGARVLLRLADRGFDEADLDDAERERLHRHRRRVGTVVTDLAARLWPETSNRDERREAATLVRYCLVDLPSALLLADDRLVDPVPRRALEHAVRGIVAAGPTSR